MGGGVGGGRRSRGGVVVGEPVEERRGGRGFTAAGGGDEALLDAPAGEHLVLMEEGLVEELAFDEGADDLLHLGDSDAGEVFQDKDALFGIPGDVIAAAVDGAEEHDGGGLALDAVFYGDGADLGVAEEVDVEGEVIESGLGWSCHGKWGFLLWVSWVFRGKNRKERTTKWGIFVWTTTECADCIDTNGHE